jgi:hypothetical protein
MRNFLILLSTTALAACGGGEPTSVGGVAVGSGTVTPGTPTPPAVNDAFGQFAAPTVSKTYNGVGGSQVFDYITDDRQERFPNRQPDGSYQEPGGQQGQQFAGSTTSVRDSKINITYDPKAAVYTLAVRDPLTGALAQTRFQDPASRTDFKNSQTPQFGVPDLSALPAGQQNNNNVQYFEAGDGDPLSRYLYSGAGPIFIGNNQRPNDGGKTPGSPANYVGSSTQAATLFIETPGVRTKYVTFAGYVRNTYGFRFGSTGLNQIVSHLERGAFAYGAQTANADVPTIGTGSYTGGLIATLVFNPTLDGAYGKVLPTNFQWLYGTSTTTVDFAKSTVALALSGTVLNAFQDIYSGDILASVPDPVSSLTPGTTFTANGTATIDIIKTGGFTGQFSSANFGGTVNGSPTAVSIAGSTIDGAFYGPKGQEVGGGFHIVGGIPDQRIDILGAFTGK